MTPALAVLLFLSCQEPVSDAEARRRDLLDGMAALESADVEAALAALERAHAGGPYAYEDVVALYHSLGIARAYVDDEAGALSAFEKLLAIAPGHKLPYTTSPKATFVFQRALDKSRARRALSLEVRTEPLLFLDQPVVVRVARPADPDDVVKKVALLHRRKGEAELVRVELAAPAVGGETAVELPAVSSSDAVADDEGEAGALLEMALLGYDERGWEVYRGPLPERPLEVPVGFAEPTPWYAEWWVWAVVGGVALGTATAVGSAVFLLTLKQTDATLRYSVVTGE